MSPSVILSAAKNLSSHKSLDSSLALRMTEQKFRMTAIYFFKILVIKFASSSAEIYFVTAKNKSAMPNPNIKL